MSELQFDFLQGEIVNQLWFWGMIRLVFDQPSERSWYVDVQRVRLVQPEGSVSAIDATGPALKMAPILQLLKQRVTVASTADGVLRIQFDNGLMLEALPDDRYESWTVAGPNGVTQCLAGGETTGW